MVFRSLLILVLLLASPARAQDEARNLTFEELRGQAAAGDPAAAELLADAYAEGRGAPRDLALAIENYQLALSRGRIWVPFKLAKALYRRGGPQDMGRAHDVLKLYAGAFRERYAGDPQAFVNYLMLMSNSAQAAERYGEALAADEESLSLVSGNPGFAAQIRSNMANSLIRLGRAEDAIRQLNLALPDYIAAFGANDLGVTNIHNNLAIAYEESSRFGEAVAEYREALRLTIKAHGRNHIQTAVQKANLASGLDRIGRSEEAIGLYEAALATIRRAEGESSIRFAQTSGDAGTVYAALGRYAEALAAEQEAIRVADSILGPSNSYSGAAYLARANILTDLQRDDEALAAYRMARGIFAAIHGEGHETVATLDFEIASGLSSLGRNAEAIAAFDKVIPELERLLGPDADRVAMAYNNLASAHAAAGDYDAALRSQMKSRAIAEKLYGPANWQTADDTINIASHLEHLGRNREALDLYLAALPLQKNGGVNARLSLRRTYWGLARNLKALGRPRAAALFSKLSINAHEALRGQNRNLPPDLRQALARNLRQAYGLLVEQQIADGAYSQAQYVDSLTKLDEVAELAGGNASTDVALTPSERDVLASFERLTEPVSAAARDLQEAAGTSAAGPRKQAFEASLAIMRKEAGALFGRAEADRQRIQAEIIEENRKAADLLRQRLAALGRDAVIYQAVSAEDALHLFVTLPGGRTSHHQVAISRADLARKVYDAAAAVEAVSPGARDRLQELYGLLIAPAADDLAASRDAVLMLNLSGYLRYVPYAALYSGERYLVEDHALALFSPAAGTRFATLGGGTLSGAGFGVSEPHDGFAALPGVPRELEDVFRGADGNGVLPGRVRLDKGFTEKSLKAALRRKPRILHIASHFRFVPGREDQSYLLLGDGKTLPLSELRRDKALRFSGVDLLTLSACETARGGGGEGEEIESFGALAQSNGAAAVMATLWPIADQSSARLMADFYRGLVEDGLDKASALRRAQIAMLRGVPLAGAAVRGASEAGAEAPDRATASHPYYWSAFILMGNWL